MIGTCLNVEVPKLFHQGCQLRFKVIISNPQPIYSPLEILYRSPESELLSLCLPEHCHPGLDVWPKIDDCFSQTFFCCVA